MKIEDESDLRKWLKEHWPGTIDWIEPGRGSGIGYPDCNLNMRSRRLPTELKVWHWKPRGLHCKMRPAQIRYHMLEAAKHDRRTAIIAAWLDPPRKTNIYLLPGCWCPLTPVDKLVPQKSVFIASADDKNAGDKLLKVLVLKADKHWERNKREAVLRLGTLGKQPRIAISARPDE